MQGFFNFCRLDLFREQEGCGHDELASLADVYDQLKLVHSILNWGF